MNILTLYAFGPPRLEADSEIVNVERRKALALIVYLVITRNRFSRDALATLLWPEQDRGRARGALRRLLWEINRSLGEGFLETDGDNVAAHAAVEIWVDVQEFNRCVDKYQSHQHETLLCDECKDAILRAAELYSDDFLAGFTLRDSPEFDEWQFFQTEQLRGEFATSLDLLVRHYGESGNFDQAITLARRRLKLDPIHEPAHRSLMQLYAWSGQRAAAMRQYAQCKHVLKEELGITPQAATHQLYEKIKRAPQRVAYLRLLSGPGGTVGERYVLGEATTIGYGQRTNDIHLQDGYVSKQHARVDYENGRYVIHDLGSKNGTLLRGERVVTSQPQLLQPSDELQMGQTHLVFEYATTGMLNDPDEPHETLQM